MDAVRTFESKEPFLRELLEDIRDGMIQLPDFQRGWIWDDEHIRSLLASISLAYPIGAVMMLKTGNPDMRIKSRLVEGVEISGLPNANALILDGQQRLTSLYQSLFQGKAVRTRNAQGKVIQRWYYLNIQTALDPVADRDDAIIGLPEDRQIRDFRGQVIADYSSLDKEVSAGLLPLSLVFDIGKLNEFMTLYVQMEANNLAERMTNWTHLLQSVVQSFQLYKVPVIQLHEKTPKEAVCQVFEKVNTGGVPLTVFELLTATYAIDDFNLRQDWADCEKRLRKFRVLEAVESTDFLQAVTLITAVHRKSQYPEAAVSCKRKDVLRLTLEDYMQWAEPITKGFEKAARFLHTQKVYSASDLPYRTQLVPLAVLYAYRGEIMENDAIRAKLSQWYWCGVFGELYGGSVETRVANDAVDFMNWIDGGSLPRTVVDCNFSAARLFTLRMRLSAAYKGLNALLLRDGALDFRTGEAVDVQLYFDERIDIHHIFPRDYCRKQNIDVRQYDCVVNKTPLSAKTNRMIGGKAPSIYLKSLQSSQISNERMDQILVSHVIDPVALRNDDFEAFFTHRMDALIARIERVTGKVIARDADVSATSDEYDIGDPEDQDDIAAG